MISLELFSGCGHITKCFKDNGFDTITLDYDKKHKSDICVDLLEWDYKKYEPGFFNFIWASPDCTSWSIATHRHRTLKEGLLPKTEIARNGNDLILKTLEIIAYFQPEYFIIENPRGRLRHYEPMKILPYRTTVYYSNYGFKFPKPTDLWSNVPLWTETRKSIDEPIKFSNFSRNRTIRSHIPINLIHKIYNHLYK